MRLPQVPLIQLRHEFLPKYHVSLWHHTQQPVTFQSLPLDLVKSVFFSKEGIGKYAITLVKEFVFSTGKQYAEIKAFFTLSK